MLSGYACALRMPLMMSECSAHPGNNLSMRLQMPCHWHYERHMPCVLWTKKQMIDTELIKHEH